MLKESGKLFDEIFTSRDVTVQNYGDFYSVIACDSLGAIGLKSEDLVKVDPFISGKYTTRVCLNELFSLGVIPSTLISLVSNEWEPTGRRVLDGINDELNENGLELTIVNGSTEENFSTTMTALGIVALGNSLKLKWRKSVSGSFVYLAGFPYIGEKVIENKDRLLSPKIIYELMDRYEIGDFIPCGSGGIAKEIEVLKSETGLSFEQEYYEEKIDFSASAGPATCGIFTTKDVIEHSVIPITLLGKLEG